MSAFIPLDRAFEDCDHEPEFQMDGTCLRCGMITSLEDLRRAMGDDADLSSARIGNNEPFDLLDRAFEHCDHEPQFQVHGTCLRCGMITSMEKARRAPQPPFSQRSFNPPQS